MSIVLQLKPHFNTTLSYLDSLAPNIEEFTFQTFPDAECDKDNKELTRTLHGTLKQHFDTLCSLNDRGAGIFVTVQETNLKGRKEVDILNIRAYFCDHDNKLPDTYHLEPTFIVETSGNKGHSYWVLNDYEKANKENFQSLQNRLIEHYQSDKACKDLARVMRLPGFFHNKDKDNPQMVKTFVVSEKTYTKQEIEANLSTLKVHVNSSNLGNKRANTNNKSSKSLSFKELLNESIEVVMQVTQGNRNNVLFERCLMLAKRAKQLNDEHLLQEIQEELTAAAELTGLSFYEIERTIKSAIDTGYHKESDTRGATKASKVELMKDVVSQLNLKFDKLNDVILLDGKAISESQLWEDLCIQSGIDFNFESLMRVVQNHAQSNIFCPVQEYLKSLPITNNPNEILGKLYKSLHVTDELHKTLIRKWLISAVARALEPGCQADNALIFYSAKQGMYKTSFFRHLFGDFFQTLGHHKSEVDELQSLYKKWCAEHGEIEFAISQKEVGRLKGFLTQTEDTFRGSYDRRATTKQRHFILCGTTNKEHFLKDTTGNRRFWVVEINKKIDINFVKENRDLIWAAILALYNSNEEWWLDENTEIQLQKETQQYEQENSYVEIVASYIERHNPCTVTDIMKNALEIPLHMLNKKNIQGDVAEALRILGCYKDQKRIDGVRGIYWYNPKYQPKPELKEGDF